MIECMSNPSWISPQIDFLLFLQNIRMGTWDIIDKFFLSITIFGEFWLPTIICAITYWCIDYKAGIYLFSMESFNIFIAHFLKMIACVYRPWVLDNRIQPSKLAVPFAKGYSFPSGHSIMSSSVVGGVAYLLKKHKWICTLLIFLVLLIGFSRLWLGVHTPQDVVCGLFIGFCLIFIVSKIVNWAENDKKRYWYLLIATDIFVILALVYVYFFNTYRIDYVDGQILVDPQHLKYVTTVIYGYSLGLINGCYLCRIFNPFNPKDVPVKQRIIRGVIGSIILILMLKYVLEYIIMNIISIRYGMIYMFLVGIFITLIYPIIFSKLKKI